MPNQKDFWGAPPTVMHQQLKKGNRESSFHVSNSEVQPKIWSGAIQFLIFLNGILNSNTAKKVNSSFSHILF